MSVSYVSSVSDVPGVQTAISHLQDLQTNMQAVHGFQPGDVSHIDVIIQCIQDLERERMKAHELLETETIKASVLRHKLMYYPDEIKNEISEAVSAARRDNEEELASLNKELNKINEDIAFSSAKLKEIDAQNAILHPERDRVKAENEEVIAMLNERMADKAHKQITLNDTRDKLRDTHQRILDLDEGLVILKEDLIQERNDHRIEKTRLKGLSTEAADKTREQKHNNAVKKLELTNIREQHSQLLTEFKSWEGATLKLEASIAELRQKEEELEVMLENQKEANEKLRKKGVELDEHGAQMDKSFEIRKAQALAKIEKMNRDIDREKERGEVLEGQRREAELKYEQANETRKAYEEKVNELKDQLQRAQDMYTDRVEEIGRLTQETEDMELRLIELAEEHELLVRNLTAEIESEREKLATKRRERMELQKEREQSQKVLTDFRTEQQRYLRDMNKQISELRSNHDSLTQEGRELRKIIKQNDKDIVTTKDVIAKAEEEAYNSKTSLTMMIERLEASVSKLQSETDEKQRILDEKIPIFEALEKAHNEMAEAFDQVKKNIVVLKNKKNGLDDSVKRVQRDIEKLNYPRQTAEADLKNQRALALSQFNSQAEARTATERELYSVGARLKTVLEENDRFKNAIKQNEIKKENLLKDLEFNAMKKERLARELEHEKAELIRAWLLDQNMTEATALRDQDIVEQFTELLGRTEERQKIIAGVSGDLSDELSKLDQFIQTASSKRPKEVRKEIKKMSRQFSQETGTRPVSRASSTVAGTVRGGETSRNESRAQSRLPSRANSKISSLLAPETIADKF